MSNGDKDEQGATPRTDAAVAISNVHGWRDGGEWVRADVSRQLERELAEEKESHRISVQLAESLQSVTERRADLAQRMASSVVPSLAPTKPLGYCLMAQDGRMLWDGECVIATDKNDLNGPLEILQDDEPDDGWAIVPFYAAVPSPQAAPVEPTEEMLQAAMEADEGSLDTPLRELYRLIYMAMVAARSHTAAQGTGIERYTVGPQGAEAPPSSTATPQASVEINHPSMKCMERTLRHYQKSDLGHWSAPEVHKMNGHWMKFADQLERELNAALSAIAPTTSADTARLDCLQRIKEVTFRAANYHALNISKVAMFSVPTQHITHNTVRECLDALMAAMDDNSDGRKA